ncbi:serine/threonine-protein kinase HipA [Leucobacter exalbidus]|uniref:Serine/threonine-protein kinase HipA n=2 Tax=Leucobacter exalbidus TaxID=662960 RepID=A0A940PXR6_9MICO|nr:serine/threonine-protein kinase HipA [Leucobacter exalbidus]
MRSITGARSTGAWDLLYAVEGDLPGGVLLHPSENGFDEGVSYTLNASQTDISARIANITAGGSGFGDYNAPPRFSLAGAQGKFALVIEEEGVYWPDKGTPSTHIVKPARKELLGLEELEAASLHLASQIRGVKAAHAELREFGGVTAFTVERFDRERDEAGNVRRLHMEDLTQALGREPAFKYSVSAPQTIRLLRTFGIDDDVQYEFVRQLAFNVGISNADAHAKNYSLLHTGDGRVKMTPMYDTIPMLMFPEYEQRLGMKIGNQRHAKNVSVDDWVYLSKQADLDPDRVVMIAREVSEGILANIDDAYGDTDRAKQYPDAIPTLKRLAERTLR